AKCIANSVLALMETYQALSVYVSGGGYLNKTLMKNVEMLLPQISIENTSVLGMNPDAKEAVLFALLANETVAGSPIPFPESSGALSVCFGKIIFTHKLLSELYYCLFREQTCEVGDSLLGTFLFHEIFPN